MTHLVIFGARYLFLIVLFVATRVFWKASAAGRRVLLLRGLIVLALGVLLAKGGGALWQDPRPFVVSHHRPLIAHAPDTGFPSDHALLTFGCAFLLLPFSCKAALVAIGLALLVGISRVACGLHWPVDIIAGMVFAAVANAAAFFLVRPRSVLTEKEAV